MGFLNHLNVNKLTKFAAGNELSNRTSTADKQLFIQSQHSSMISGLQARHSIYGPVVRYALVAVYLIDFYNALLTTMLLAF